jgi:uncharacterized protein
MQLYTGMSQQFIEDTFQDRITQKLEQAFLDRYSHEVARSEARAWENSLLRMGVVLQDAGLLDHGVILEYKLGLTSRRLDCMVTGTDSTRSPNTVIVELKQWDHAEVSNAKDNVLTLIGGRVREVLHPSSQVGGYEEFLEYNHTTFSAGSVGLASCCYLHNLRPTDGSGLFDPRYDDLLKMYPVFTRGQGRALGHFLRERVGTGAGEEVMETVIKGEFKASKKLLEHVRNVIRGERSFILLDEQKAVFNRVLKEATSGARKKGRVVILAKGGPGTGKSVIAMNLMSALSGAGLNTQYATGSKAFTENLRNLLGRKAGIQLKYFSDYMSAGKDVVDIIVCDESHRLWETGNTRFTPKAKRSDRPLVEHVMEAAKVTVFFIDDLQFVRPNEVGNSELIGRAAKDLDATLHEFDLEAQFRVAGSEGFINWVDNTLGTRRAGDDTWDVEEFDFRIVKSVEELEAMIREKQAAGSKARLTAGFCWPWSDPDSAGRLISDVRIGNWEMPWNAKPGRRLAPDIPIASLWATDPNGIEQVGCIYTAQGFEFDYIGVIFGKDLIYDPTSRKWIGDRTKSFDKMGARRARTDGEFLDLVKNTYRVLLTRGMKGCYIYFQDENTRDFFRSRIASAY